MDRTREPAQARLVLLDTWLFEIWVETELPERDAEELQLLMGRELTEIARRLAALVRTRHHPGRVVVER